MKYTPKEENVLLAITYGSRLYGTSTPASDYDFKAISLPSHRDLILNKTLSVQRCRFDADGNHVGDSQTMPDNGYEAEHTPVQKFVADYLGGQAYAVEFVYAVLNQAHTPHLPAAGSPKSVRAARFVALCKTLAAKFKHKNVAGMIGFANKQTFDYVRRGERLNAARKVQEVACQVQAAWADSQAEWTHDIKLQVARLDHTIDSSINLPLAVSGDTVLSYIAREAGLQISAVANGDKVLKTLGLNGRQYTETTALSHFQGAIDKMIEQYGVRSAAASQTSVDWKSLSHAVRVYQQVIELLNTGFIRFPRPNAAELLEIRLGSVDLEQVKQQLRDLDDETSHLLESTLLPIVDQAMRSALDTVLYDWLNEEYV